MRSFVVKTHRRGCDQLVDIFLTDGGEISGSQHPQSSGSNWSGVSPLLSSILLNSSFWWRFQYLQNSSKIFLHISLEGVPRP